MNPHPVPPASRSTETVALLPAIFGEVARAAKADTRPAQARRDPGLRRRAAARSTSIFAARSRTCWRGCRNGRSAARAIRTPRQPAPRGPGRPKLGVVAREVTLLPRHWEWLAQQPGGASVAMRRLVDEARRSSKDKDRSGTRRKRPIASSRRWPRTSRITRRSMRALFAGDAGAFRGMDRTTGPLTCAITLAGSRRARFEQARRRAPPVDPANVNR